MEILNTDLTLTAENASDDEITRRKNDIPDIIKRMDNLSKLIKESLNICVIDDDTINESTKVITSKYDTLCSLKENYIKVLKHEVENRELGKQELFKEGKLNIHLSKFGGYDSKLDFYSFKSDFLKLHERTTPKRLLPDLLKNNFLENSALALVNSLDNIEEIWDRLKDAYGDPKLLLKKKLSELDKISFTWKIRNPEKIVLSLTKLINVMKDLMKLASEHNIESKLYNGDGIDRIYVLLGDNKLTKWLSYASEKELTDKGLWNELVFFLEKDLKVQQQKVLIQNKFEELKTSKRNDDKEKSDKRSIDRSSSHYSGENQGNICHFCDGHDHIATSAWSTDVKWCWKLSIYF